MQRILALLTVSVMIGCAPAKFDLTDEDTVKRSVAAVMQALEIDEQKEFKVAVANLATSMMARALRGEESEEEAKKKIAEALHERTAEEVLREAEAAKAALEEAKKRDEEARKDLARQMALVEIAELTEHVRQTSEIREELRKFEVVASNLRKSKGAFSFNDKVLTLGVKNASDLTIAKVYFESEYVSPDRALPWATESFWYEIDGGLEPGEQGEWHLDPGYDELSKVTLHENAVLTTVINGVIFADGTELVAKQTPDELLKRLEALTAAFGETSL